MDYRSICIFVGLIVMIATGSSKPASENADEPLQSDQSDDYEYEDRNLSTDQAKSTAAGAKTTMLPYFETKTIRKFIKTGTINGTLVCPVKNLTETNVILWFRGDNPITNNLNVLDTAYDVTKQNFSLVIKNATESLSGNYYCEIAPQKIRMQTVVKISNEDIVPVTTEQSNIKKAENGTNADGGSSQMTAIFSLVIVSVISLHILSHMN